MSDIAKLKKLQELRIGSGLTDVGVSALAGHNQLQFLGLFNNTRVTNASIQTVTTLTALRELELTGANLKLKSQFLKALPPAVKVR